ncbi:MAG: metallophosphoesterase, partial [Lachnospiraceae bacterium]|nr:metallophosphoesterase [Lachnospiraceae bacterium]
MKLRATGYMVKSERLPKEFNGFKVAVLSDLHDTVYGSNNIELFRRIEIEKPDIVLVAGDLITGLADRKFDAAI